MKTFPTIEQLVEAAAKGGHNPEDAKGVIAKNYNYLKQQYPAHSPKKLVYIAYVIY